MYRFITFLIAVSFLCISCKDNSILSKMDHIKTVGDENPALALKMLDSIYVDARNASEYAMMKYDLLKVRLEDKSYIPHTSNRTIENLVKYFEDNGQRQAGGLLLCRQRVSRLRRHSTWYREFLQIY